VAAVHVRRRRAPAATADTPASPHTTKAGTLFPAFFSAQIRGQSTFLIKFGVRAHFGSMSDAQEAALV
jgi:hypothetical protein